MNDYDLALFLDTNTLLHYPPLKDVDWRAVGGCAKVRLVLCMQVVHELDGKKDDPRLGERASRTIKDTKAIRKAAGAVREGVTLEVFKYEVRAGDFPDTLSFESKDDRIVRTVKKYQGEHPGMRVEVYTEDMGMSLRCEANNVAVIEPDKTRRLENPQDEFAKKYKQVTAELNEFKTRLPIVEVVACATGLSAPEKRALEFALPGVIVARDLDAELAEHQRENKLGMMSKSEIRGFGASPVLPLRHDAVERYNKKLTDHINKYRQWLEHMSEIDLYESYQVEFALWLSNIGSAPADDIFMMV